ncbi:1,4-dihydroxy-2-naphthoate octaprenyltransferase [Nonlabens spongiae]|uniref:1,4-dihydroxy-2-naphthoate octaprenyltransferase n=1 Tax=Nonlabens spongiae TaxID=331648 RepID=A0A1W6MJF6_9FLAO|nr:1,4-dihydroxy-2-naphthoate octaprenyltransferase [Nonlabens spongiae]ARN77741.1 1,4-dihydroxy-2-naphthoate octaprenyltransferase [Nonlabens spongiae]
MGAPLKAWISAARLRTLPLSISGILMGISCAYFMGNIPKIQSGLNPAYFDPYFEIRLWKIAALGLITTLLFQILSNFANDYGDGTKGTDNDKRIGPIRAIQSGLIRPSQMKRAVIITSILSFISAVALISVSLGFKQLLIALFFLVLGVAAIWAAIKYTVGDDAYGYSGLGDLFVFIFFGPVSVMGIYYLVLQQFNIFLILPSLTIGLLSVAVLNLNNMRDIENDQVSGKNTVVVKIGLAKAKVFHLSLIAVAFVSLIYYLLHLKSLYSESTILIFFPLVAFTPLIAHCIKVLKNDVPALFDPELKKVALSTFLLSLITLIVLISITIN